jgi:ribonuclease T1
VPPLGRLLRSFRLGGAASALLLAAALGGASGNAQALAPSPGASSTEVAVSQLPSEARRTQQLIREGGPFPYTKDGTVFGNRERLLPRARRGYYREYTVPTPGSRDRGARRIVCGGQRPTAPDACYYTDDHYASFRLIAQ